MRFLVNGNRCELSISQEAIVWTPTKEQRSQQQVSFDHVIGFRLKGPEVRSSSFSSDHGGHQVAAVNASKRHRCSRLKIYYSRLKGNKAHLKRLTVQLSASRYNQPSKDNQDNQQHQQQQQHGQQTQCSSIDEEPSSSLVHLAKLVEASLETKRRHRPRRLLVFVNPFGGKGRATNLYHDKVKWLLSLADIESRLVVTERANQARDAIEDPRFNVQQYDGIICVGGDGMFSELMNGLLFRYNRSKILRHLGPNVQPGTEVGGVASSSGESSPAPSSSASNDPTSQQLDHDDNHDTNNPTTPLLIVSNYQNYDNVSDQHEHKEKQNVLSDSEKLARLRSSLGGIGIPFDSPPIPIGVIGAGSTDANSFGLIGTNDVTSATLNIILGNQISIDICSVHSADNQDTPIRFVSTFAAYGYFGDVIRESERLRWLGPSRYDLTGFRSLLKNRSYPGVVRALICDKDGTPSDELRCHAGCEICLKDPSPKTDTTNSNKITRDSQTLDENDGLRFVELKGSFAGVNAAVTACRCDKSKKGFAPNNHLANGCADLILVRPCSRVQYLRYLLRTGYGESAFNLSYVDAYRCRQFEFEALDQENEPSGSTSSSATASSTYSTDSIASHKSGMSSWNLDGEMLDNQSIRVKVNNRLLRVFGRGEALV